MKMQKIKIGDYDYFAENCIDGILINPKLPKNFDVTDNTKRPESHQKFWWLPFVTAGSVQELDDYHTNRTDEFGEKSRSDWFEKGGREDFLKHYPTGMQYCVRCLDGGAWDRSTNYGFYADFEEALATAVGLKR